jgi:RND superfamily putative drug exporter
VVGVVHVLAPRWDEVTYDGDFAYLPDSMTSVRGERLLAAAFPDYYSKSQLALVVARDKGRLTEKDLLWADQLLEAFPPNQPEEEDTAADEPAPAQSPPPSDVAKEPPQEPAAEGNAGPAPVASGEAKPESPEPVAPAKSTAPADPASETLASTAAPEPPRTADADPDAKPAVEVDPENPVTAVWSFNTPVIGKKLVSRPSEQGQAALIVLHLGNEFMAVDNMKFMRRVYETIERLQNSPDCPKGLKLGVTGSAAIGSDMLFSAEESIRNTELTTILLVVIILLVVYRAPGLVLVPLITIGASVWLAMDIVAMMAALSRWCQQFDSLQWFDFKIFKTTRIFIVVILFGAGTDFCLFLISRYKEELHDGASYPRAAGLALGHVGNALAASALTTIFGLAMMFFADFGKFSNSGPAIALCLVVALIACVTLAPALLCASRGVVFWPFGVKADGQAAQQTGLSARWTGSFWERISRGIIARPGLILVGSLLILLPFTRPVRALAQSLFSRDSAPVGARLSVPVTYNLLAELSPDRPSVRGTNLLWRHFPADQTGPLTVLVNHPDVDFNSEAGEERIAELTQELFDFEITNAEGETVKPVVTVRSLWTPLGGTPGSYNLLSRSGRQNAVARKRKAVRGRFVSQTPPWKGHVARFDIVSIYPPFSPESVAMFSKIEADLLAKTKREGSDWCGAEIDFVGTAAGIRDLEAVTSSDRIRIQLLVMIAVLAVLIAILRRPMICVYLIASVLLGYYVTIGATELLFSWIYGDTYTGLDWKVPIFLFVILIAVGQDYNIYLATRVFEEQRRLGPTEGLRVAVVKTGGIITSCGVIMAGTFVSMATGTLRTMQELGFALAVGVLLDTFVIRTILVPAFLALLARREEEPISPKSEPQMHAGRSVVSSR